MNKEYNPKEIESKWQREWEKNELYKIPDTVGGKENEYVLVEFAYPSGNLHSGHWYAFSVTDIYARFRRMLGKNVMFPFGFDAFGLPAENAAIKRGLNPRSWTYDNIAYMKKQLVSMGTMFDWSREVITSDPEYYKWTQWLFLELFKKGLAYRAKTKVNWCPSDKTVLANEQVVDDKCERCGATVEEKEMEQWMLRITDYADRLIDDLDTLDWPEPIKQAQRNWIGRSEGAEIEFPISNSQFSIKVFTTRPDTIFGATFLVKAGKEDRFTGEYVTNPATKEQIPVWEAEYVMEGVGTGAVMGVPAHDERDFAFAKKHNLPVRTVVVPVILNIARNAYDLAAGTNKNLIIKSECWEGEGELVNSAEFNGLKTEEARKKIIEKFGVAKTTYKLHDWVISRQRYWGCPIPVIHCETCGVSAVPEKDLPIVLPEIEDFLPTGDGKSPLAKVPAFVDTRCPQCGGVAKRETDTFDTFIDSSWYFLRYADPKNEKVFADKEKLKNWIPVNFYSGGAEHTTMHLLYSRFFHKALFDLGLVNESEPFTRRMNRGLILGPDGNKMSKSKGNVVDPDDYVQRLGADTVRTYLAFIGPYNETGSYPWSPDSIVGVRRFLEKVWRLKDKVSDGDTLTMSAHQAIKKVEESLQSLKMNTGVASLMIFTNDLEKQEKVSQAEYETLLKLLAPFVPHMTEELWHLLGHTDSIHLATWPSYDESKLISDVMTVVVQVNGRVRGQFSAARGITESEAIIQATNLPEVQKWVVDKQVQKSVYVPGRVVNLVVS